MKDPSSIVASDLSTPERVLLFCIASGTEWAEAGVTGKTETAMVVRGLIDRDSAGRWADDVAVPTFGPRMVCTGCGIVGADARPNWQEQPPRETLTGVQWQS